MFFLINPIHLLLFTSLLFFQTPIKAQDLIWCDGPSNYTSNSQFNTNLNNVLSSLITNTLPTGFYNTTLGRNPDRVYVIAQCRPDISNQDCRSCLNTSTVEILRRCPNKKDAIIRYDNCVLRYSNQSFFSIVDSRFMAYGWNLNNVSDPVLFNRQLGSLMKNLSDTAASDEYKFKTGVTDFTDFSTIYGLVQCTRDLSNGGCSSCLESLRNWIPVCCDSKQGAGINTFSCNIRYEIYPFFEAAPPPPTSVIAPPPQLVAEPPSPPPPPVNETSLEGNKKKSSRAVLIIVVVVVVVVISLALISTVCICLLGRKREKKAVDVGKSDEDESAESLLFDLGTLKAATNDFSNANKLGEGGFGPVYKGKLSNGQEIAVKRLSRSSGQGLEELRNEVVLLAKLQHRNLVRLLGCCLEEEEKLLVYEYLPNTSLEKFLFADPLRRVTLDWERRYMIISGIARGLLYLHEDSQLRIIHRDMKASNILLDEEMNPKISDFGLARLFLGDQSQENTNHIAGTIGYMAPEYNMHGFFSPKSDVFSFGVLVLEIVSGRKNSRFQDSGGATDLLSYAWQHWSQGTTSEFLDETIGEPCPRNEVLRCIHLGLLCVQEDAADRPTMSTVVLMLNSYSISFPVPSEPAFFVGDSRMESDVLARDINQSSSTTESGQSTNQSRPATVNEVSITELEPR